MLSFFLTRNCDSPSTSGLFSSSPIDIFSVSFCSFITSFSIGESSIISINGLLGFIVSYFYFINQYIRIFFFEFIIITLSLNSVKSIVSISVSFSEKNVFRITMIFNLDLRIPFLSVISSLFSIIKHFVELSKNLTLLLII
jgi:hypothetical protein